MRDVGPCLAVAMRLGSITSAGGRQHDGGTGPSPDPHLAEKSVASAHGSSPRAALRLRLSRQPSLPQQPQPGTPLPARNRAAGKPPSVLHRTKISATRSGCTRRSDASHRSPRANTYSLPHVPRAVGAVLVTSGIWARQDCDAHASHRRNAWLQCIPGAPHHIVNTSPRPLEEFGDGLFNPARIRHHDRSDRAQPFDSLAQTSPLRIHERQRLERSRREFRAEHQTILSMVSKSRRLRSTRMLTHETPYRAPVSKERHLLTFESSCEEALRRSRRISEPVPPA